MWASCLAWVSLVVSLPMAAQAMTPDAATARAQALLQSGQPAAQQAQASPRDTYIVRRAEPLKPDEAGQFHVRFDRAYQGVPVLGGDIIVHLMPDGALNGVTTTLTQPLALASTTPAIDRAQAQGRALEMFRRDGKDESSTVELVIDTPSGEPAALVWLVKVSGSRCRQPSLMHYFIDAQTGALARKYEGLNTGLPIRC